MQFHLGDLGIAPAQQGFVPTQQLMHQPGQQATTMQPQLQPFCSCVTNNCSQLGVLHAPQTSGPVCVCTSLVHEIRGSQPISCCLDRFDSFVPIYQFSLAGGHSMSLGLCPTKLPVTWEERTDHPLVPATKFVTSLSCRLCMVPFCDILAVQRHLSRAAQFCLHARLQQSASCMLAPCTDPHDITFQCA